MIICYSSLSEKSLNYGAIAINMIRRFLYSMGSGKRDKKKYLISATRLCNNCIKLLTKSGCQFVEINGFRIKTMEYGTFFFIFF